MNALYGLLFAVTYSAVVVIAWVATGVVKLVRGYFYWAYQWQPTRRGQPRYEVTPAFDASVTAAVLMMGGMYAYLAL